MSFSNINKFYFNLKLGLLEEKKITKKYENLIFILTSVSLLFFNLHSSILFEKAECILGAD